MILVDTSVLIDFFKGIENKPTRKFKKILTQKIPFGINSFIYQEVLQGAKSEQEYVSASLTASSQIVGVSFKSSRPDHILFLKKRLSRVCCTGN